MRKQSIIGALNIDTNSGTIINGDMINISPTEITRSFRGSGIDVTGDHATTVSIINITMIYGSSPIDDSPTKLKRKVSKLK
ncbi:MULTISPECIES: spore germination protein [Paenibacillus]|uniref:Spore germination protein n=1 Tax=Paenibacillus violae TaxID=3077234 RepID=A0ABU3RKD5_9BACL|nr:MULTISPECIES: spore germination protein [Paenibacillus]MDU0204667.1 spore germination protein [Paenibacillus sp. PFR10]MEC0270424.1 spore germination protein [Paenibacillus anseongense]